MKKCCLIIILTFLWYTQSCNVSLADSFQTNTDSGTPLKSQGKGLALLERTSTIEVIPDNFGGYLCFYKDEKGNKCASNMLGDFIERSRVAQATTSVSSGNMPDQDLEGEPYEDLYDFEMDEPLQTISDPLESVNRLFFYFNDGLYFWFLKPAATGYKAVVPKPVRVSVRNFFSNLAFPIRFVNCILQAKFKGAGYEFGRFMVNSTVGVAGFFDMANKHFNMKEYDEDLGQTLGSYGMGPGFYINWPFLGPSSVLDTIGLVGDSFLDPTYYTGFKTKYKIAIKGFKAVNETSLVLGEYEDLKRSALDPYISIRDAYYQYRQKKIKE